MGWEQRGLAGVSHGRHCLTHLLLLSLCLPRCTPSGCPTGDTVTLLVTSGSSLDSAAPVNPCKICTDCLTDAQVQLGVWLARDCDYSEVEKERCNCVTVSFTTNTPTTGLALNHSPPHANSQPTPGLCQDRGH